MNDETNFVADAKKEDTVIALLEYCEFLEIPDILFFVTFYCYAAAES